MATNWTNPIGPGSRLLAFDVQEVINAINANRQAAGLQPLPFSVAAGDRILASHYGDMRSAIQGLWDTKNMGALPSWTSASKPYGGVGVGLRMYASDLTDLRAWLNQYENDPPVKPSKGIHMSHNQFRDVDRKALDLASPPFGMIVALGRAEPNQGDLDLVMQHTVDPHLYPDTPKMWEVLNWFAATHGTEIFVRLHPTYGPVSGTSPVGAGYQQATPSQVVDAIVAVRNKYNANFRRIVVGNEPNIEWPGVDGYGGGPYSYHDWQGNPVTWSSQWHWGKWQAMNAYYAQVFNNLKDRKDAGTAPADIELYYPPMSQGAGAEGKKRYCDDGTVETRFLNYPDNTERYEHYGFGSYGYDHLKGSIEGEPGYTDGYKRFTWHNYFFSWHAYDGSVVRYFPAWLYADLFTIPQPFPSRITECGWFPGPLNARGGEPRYRDSAAGRYKQYTCDDPNMPNIATVTAPNGGPNDPEEGYYHEDLYWFIKHGRDATNPPASGVAVWLLSSTDPEYAPHAAIPQGISQYDERGWFTNYRQWSEYPDP